MTAPRATMRLQLHKGFTFDAAARLAPYMADLGVSHLYTSPILTARAGSMHGYDQVDPTRVNPELGGEDGFRHMVAALRSAGLGLIVDIVPNHMAVGNENPWWLDVLRHGQASRHGHVFDIDWHPDNPLLDGKVLVPVLGKPYGEVLAAGEITLGRGEHGAEARYYDKVFPIAPADEAEIEAASPAAYDPATDTGRARLHRLLDRQHYRLAWWRTAADEINWRRFFDINELAGIRAEDERVFEATHELLFRFYAQGLIDGMRVDHVDGLADPRSYCRRLHARLAELEPRRPADAPAGPAYLIVEKILGAGERLAEDWQVDGTSGYDFMDQVSAVQHDPHAASALGALWAGISGRSPDFRHEEVVARREILDLSFTAQLNATVGALHRLALASPETQDFSRPALGRALVELLAHFPAYRSYARGAMRPATDDGLFAQALAGALAAPSLARPETLELIVGWLRDPDSEQRQVATTRFQQLSAPVAAKAVEDTAFYRYGRLLSRNDVGFDAALLGTEPGAFHRSCATRCETFPDAMLATATHDHKRGEDVRARLAVISELPSEWSAAVTGWFDTNTRHRRSVEGETAPSPGHEFMLYLTIVGAWPMTLDPADADGRRAFAERIAGWQEKALREAKLRTSWTLPDAGYEQTARAFLDGIMADARFCQTAAGFANRIAPAGAVNGLAQTVLKLSVPGVPDLYQGTEFWDQSLVDPDNRRPVDYDSRMAALSDIGAPTALVRSWRDGRVKQAVIARLLAIRRSVRELFARGDYTPLMAHGPLAAHVIAFARRTASAALVVVVPRLPWALVGKEDGILIPASAWQGTELIVPPDLDGLLDALGGAAHHGERLPLGAVLGTFPAAVLVSADG